MTRLLCSLLLLAAVAAAQTTPAPAPASLADNENARQARALLDKTLAALGGPAYLTHQTREEAGRTYRFYKGNPAGTGVQFWRFWKWPDKERLEMFKQRDWIVIYDGDQGWDITFRGTRKLDDDEMYEYRLRRPFALEVVLREWLREPGVALFYEGATVAERKPAEKVTIMNARNQGVTLYIASDTFLPIMKAYTLRDPETRERVEESEIYDNYKLVQGIQAPLSLTLTRNGQMVRQRFLNTVAFNVPIPDAKFQPGPINYDRMKK